MEMKQAVQVNLRSVIQSCKGGVPLNRLQSDYKSLIGATIPFTNLGYNSLEAFLQSIPQVIQLTKTSDGQTIVEAVADSTTIHLQSLISKQKSTKTQKCSVKRCGKKPATKQKSFFCSNCASSSRSVLINSSAASSSANSKGSLASDASVINYKQEVEALKVKLAKEKEMSIGLKSRVNQLLSEREPKLEDEHTMIRRMQYQIGLLKKQMLLHHHPEAFPETLQVHQSINEIAQKIKDLVIIMERLPNHSTKPNSSDIQNGNSLQVPEYDPFKMYQQQCKETEELKKQVALQNSQIQNIERQMQSQLQKLQNQIKNDSPPSSSKEKSESAEDLRNKEQCLLQIQNVEESMMQEFMKLKNQVETEFFVHLVHESEKVKDFDKRLKAQKTQIQNIESRTQSKFQKLNNELDKISITNLADIIVKELVSNNMINIPQVLSSSNDCMRYVPPHRRVQEPAEQIANLPTHSKTTGTAKSRRRRRRKILNQKTAGMTASVMRDQ